MYSGAPASGSILRRRLRMWLLAIDALSTSCNPQIRRVKLLVRHDLAFMQREFVEEAELDLRQPNLVLADADAVQADIEANIAELQSPRPYGAGSPGPCGA